MHASADCEQLGTGHLVYEPFSGSGSTIIAAQTTGRVCLAMELDPGYCDVAVRRWEEFTGEVAVLEREGGGSAPAKLTRDRKVGNSKRAGNGKGKAAGAEKGARKAPERAATKRTRRS